MGTEERKLMKQSGLEKQEKLMDAINNATAEYEVKLEGIVKLNGYKFARIKQLALHAPPIKSRRKVSDWNIMMHFKGKQLNEGKLHYRFHVVIAPDRCFSCRSRPSQDP